MKCVILNLGMLITVLALFACGCQTGPQPWNLSIKKTTPSSIQVDLIGVPESDKPSWEGYDMTKYWSDGDLRRSEADKLTQTMQMGHPWIISLDDPKWNEWLDRGASELMIIANLPGTLPSGSADPRRLFIPLDKHAWKAKNGTLEFEVQDTIIQVLTPRNLK